MEVSSTRDTGLLFLYCLWCKVEQKVNNAPGGANARRRSPERRGAGTQLDRCGESLAEPFQPGGVLITRKGLK